MKKSTILNRAAIAACATLAASMTMGLEAATFDTSAKASPGLMADFRIENPGIKVAYSDHGNIAAIYGKALSQGEDPVESALKYITSWSDMYGVPAGEFEAVGPYADGHSIQLLGYDPGTGTYDFTLASYRQSVDGIPVFNSRLSILVRNTPGFPAVCVKSDLKPLDGWAPDAQIQEVPDPGKALAVGSRFLGLPVRLVADPEFVIFAGAEGEGLAPRLAEVFEITAGSKVDETFQRWLLVVDAANGQVLYEENRVLNHGISGCTTAAHAVSAAATADVSGNVTSQSTDGSGADICETDSSYPMPYAYVSGNNGSSTYADAEGHFELGSVGSVTVTSGFTGRWFSVNNDQGSEATYSTVIPNGGSGTVHNTNTSEFTLAQSDGYLQSNIVRDFTLYYSPSYPIIGTQEGFPVNVNLGSSCNAFYDYSSINFYNEAGGCSNTAFSVIVHHEYGHHLVDCAGSGQGAYGEGMGDVMGVLITGDNQLARGFYTNDCVNGIRNADNSVQYPCSGGIHDCGQLISGVVWDLVEIMEAAYPVDGYDTTARLVVDSMMLHNGSSIDPTILLDYLVLDDDDGDLSNGTPHLDQIQAAFDLHNMGDIPEPLDNDDCVTAREITWGTWDVNTVGAQSSGVPVDESQCSGTYMTECDPDVWYHLTACDTGTMTVSLCDSINFDSDLAVYTGDCNNLSQIACNGDASGCGGYTSYLTVSVTQGQSCYIRVGGWNGASGSGTMLVEGPGDPCEGVDVISFDFPDGLPSVLDPAGGSTIRVEVSGSGEVEPVPGSGQLAWRQGGAWTLQDMTDVSENVYDAVFPELECYEQVEYYFSVESSQGEDVTYPSPGSYLTASVYTDIVVVYEDDCETDTGWSVSGGASDGQWDRGIPVNCQRCDPPADADGSGQSWLTDNSSASACNSDVDGGQTILTSPVLDASKAGAVVSYSRWYNNGAGCTTAPQDDYFLVEASDDGGSSWVTLEVVGPGGPEANGDWYDVSFVVSEISGITPSEDFRLRFIAEDINDGSVIEAGVDAISISVTTCDSEPTCEGDTNGDAEVNVEDLLGVIAAWGDTGSPYDLDGSGTVDVADLLIVIAAWGPCP